MKRIKKHLQFLALIISSIILFDVFSFFFLADLVQKINPYYNNDLPEKFGPYQTRHHLRPHADRGFDVDSNSNHTTHKVLGGISYQVWGNSYGCFDNEWAKGKKPDVYLAGDSMTWGFSPFEKKFGTLLENKTGLFVMKCGVTHTGQRHQFSKFKDIVATYGFYPRLVIVNVYGNDIANDFSHPHSTMIEGFTVDNVELVKRRDGAIKVKRLDVDQLRTEYERYLSDGEDPYDRIKFAVRKYSAFANVAAAMTKALRSTHQILGSPENVGRGPYGLYQIESVYPINSIFAQENKEVIRRWQRDSVDNHYKLVFALIPPRDNFSPRYYKELEAFLDKLTIRNYNFAEFVKKSNIAPEQLHWPIDGHFNISGNKVYADFLLLILKGAMIN